MNHGLFREGGPHNIRKIGPDQYGMNVALPNDIHGRLARECPSETCSPGYFKVNPDTRITEGQQKAYCPYCRYAAEPNDFATKEQLRYAKDIAFQEARKGVDHLVKEAFGLDTSGRKRLDGGFLSIEMNYKPGNFPYIHHPFEEELQRVVVCSHCGLDHAVFGLAVWCPDCGRDIFMVHVETEYSVIRTMLADVDRRRNEFGARVAARDIENCLEDVVSIYEAVLKALLVRALRARQISENEIQAIIKSRVGNRLQNIHASVEIVHNELGLDLFASRPAAEVEKLSHTFEKRHPITHNLGVIDKKYLVRVLSDESEGREIRITPLEINQAIDESFAALSVLHNSLFGENRIQQTTG